MRRQRRHIGLWPPAVQLWTVIVKIKQFVRYELGSR